jgi:hypothetical protein
MTKARRTDPPLGDTFRAAHKTGQNEEEQKRHQAEKRRQQKMANTLSDFFNDIATELPAKVGAMVRKMKAGDTVEPQFRYSLTDGGDGSLRGLASFSRGLPGYKALDKASKALNVAYNWQVMPYGARRGYVTYAEDSKTFYNSNTVSVVVDVAKPYAPHL